ncbi:MAG: hypothetical protein WCQ89_09290, partial [Verrucomicrobiota bacterium]
MSSAKTLLRGPALGFPAGFPPVTAKTTEATGTHFPSGIDFGLLRPAAGDVIEEASPLETAWVLLHGTAEIECAG